MKKPKENMTGEQFQTCLNKIGMSQMGFSRFVGVGGRTVRGWVLGEYAVPKAVALLINLMIKTKTKAEDMKA